MTQTEIASITDEQKRDFCSMLVVGCDRETACKYIGYSLDELRDAVSNDPDFGKRLLRAEATAEFKHMRNVHAVTENPKEWRASIWWMERHAPERFARRADALPASKVQELINQLAGAITEEVTHDDDRRRVVDRLAKIANLLDELFVSYRFTQVLEDEAIDRAEDERTEFE